MYKFSASIGYSFKVQRFGSKDFDTCRADNNRESELSINRFVIA